MINSTMEDTADKRPKVDVPGDAIARAYVLGFYK
jgi:hypothetical protein